MNNGIKIASVLLWISASAKSYANVLSLFPAGSDAKSAAMESAIDSHEPQTLLYNPAALATSASGVNVELGAGRLLYSYEHPQFDPVRVSLFSPVVSAGWRSSDIEMMPNFHWGLTVFPSSMAQLKIKGLPRRVNGKTESLDVNTKRNQFHLAVGGSYSINGDMRNSLGASLIATNDQRSLKADSLVDGAQLVDMSSRGTFFRPELGGTYGIGPIDIGVSYMAAVTKHYKGSTTLASEPSGAFDTEQVDYDPAVLATGIRGSYDDWSASLNVNRIYGARGSSIVRDGINRKTNTADLRDVNDLGARIAYQCNPQNSVSAAYAYLPTIWGAGSYSVDADGFTHNELGHLFGTFNAMPVRNQSIAWRYRAEGLEYHSAVFRTAGTQTIDVTGDNPGYYQIEFVSVTTGITKTL